MAALTPIFLFLLCLSLLPSALSTPPPSVSTPSCDRSSSVINDLHRLPRLNMKAALINPDLGAYDWYSCTTDAQGQEQCAWFNPFSSISALYATAPSSTSPINLLQSYGVYVAFAIACALLSLLLGCGLCVGRYCCSCCIRGGTCGKRWPTLRTRCCGIQPNPFTGALEYSARERWCARGYMTLFIAMMVVWVLMSYTAGTGSIPSSMKSIAAAPTPLISQLQSLALPARDLIINLASHTVTNLVTSLNSTIAGTVDLSALVDDMTCIIDGTGPGRLPNATTLLAVISSLQGLLGGVNATLTSAQGVIRGVEGQVGNVSAGVGVVQMEVGQLEGAIAAFLSSTQAVTSSLSILATFSNNLTDTTIDSDLAGMSTALPDSTHVSNAQTELFNLAGSNSYTFTQTTATQSNLASINASYVTSPDYAHTADEMAALQADVQYLDSVGIFNSLVTQVAASQRAVNNITADILATNTTLTTLAHSTQAFNLTAPTSLLLTINGSVTPVQGLLVTIDSQLTLVSPLLGVLPCFFSALDMAVQFNASLLQLPSDFDAVVSLGPTLNSTLTSALTSVDAVQGQIDAFQAQLANLSISVYLTQLTNMTALATSSASTLLTGSTATLLTSALNSTQSANFSGVNQIIQLNTTINSIPFNASLNTALTQLQALKQSAVSLLSWILPDLQQINSYGFCSSSGAACTADANCTVGTCTSTPSSGGSPVTKRCKLSGNVACSAGDAQCTAAGDRCLVDATRYGYLRGNITVIQALTPASSQTAALLTQLDAALAQASSNSSGLSAINSTISSATQAMQGVDLSGVNASLASVTSSLGLFDASGMLSVVTAVQAALTSVDLTSAQSTVSSLSSSLNEVNADLAQLQQALQLVTSLRNLLYQQMHVYLADISRDSLLAAYNEGGLTSMAQVLLGLVDNATAYLNNSQYIQPTNLSSLLTLDISHYLDALSTHTYSAHGPLYFLGMLADQGKTLDLTLFNEALTSRVDVDVNGADYPNGTYCLTSSCVDASIDYYTTTSLKTVSSGAVPVTISGLQALSVPLVIPAVIALLGVLSMLCVKSSRWASCCASCTACLIFTAMPIIFLLVGLLWPIVVLGFADACSGGVSIGNQYVLQESQSLCSKVSGVSVGTLCTVSQFNVTFTFDVAAVYASVLGDTCSASNDPLHSTWQQIASTVASYPVTRADDAINNLETGSSEIRIRPALLNLVYAAANGSGEYFEDAVEEAGSLLGCAALSSTFQQVKGAMCCDTATTFYWAIGAWYLIAFSMLLCGWQAAVMGRKRFGDQLWGPGKLASPTAEAGQRTGLSSPPLCAACAVLCVAEVVPLVNPDAFASGQIIVQPSIFMPSPDAAAPDEAEENRADQAGQAAADHYPVYEYPANQSGYPTGHFATSHYPAHQYPDQGYDLPPPPGYTSAPESFATQAQAHYDPHQPQLGAERSIVRSSIHRTAEVAGTRTPSRHSRRPSAISTGVAYPVVVHGAEEEEEEERASPMVRPQDLAYAGQSEYLSMYPAVAGRGSSASEASDISPMPRGISESPDMRGAHLLAGYAGQSPSPQPDDSPVVTDYNDE